MERQEIFLRFKAASIHLLQALKGFGQGPGARNALIDSLTKLRADLQSVTSRTSTLDAPLIEFIFLPISKVLQVSRTVPVRALELCLECISILLRSGWGLALAPELSGQLLILFTFMAKPSSAENGIAGSTEELQTEALKCIGELFTEVSRTSKGKTHLTATANIPALGEAVLVILDSLTETNSNSIKLQALTAMKALLPAIDDKDALASFLPRIASSLTKVLTPSSTNRTSSRVLQQGVEVFDSLLVSLLCDKETQNLPKSVQQSPQDTTRVIRSVSWLQATGPQIKIALANMLKLRTHDKAEVRQGLFRLCLTIIQQCRTSLADCASMTIEAMVTMAGRGGQHDPVERDLQHIIIEDEKLSDLLKESLYGWIISLPRLMQSKDDTARRRTIHQISVTLRLLKGNQFIIDKMLAQNLRDGVSAVLNDSMGTDSLVDATVDNELALVKPTSTSFEPLSLKVKGQEDMLVEFRLLLEELAKSDTAISLAQNLIDAVDTGTQQSQLASFWISVNLLRNMMTLNPPIDAFIEFEDSNPQDELLDNLYSQSLTILSEWDTEIARSWHFEALALEVVALQATRHRSDFRAELGEALYPVLHHLGSTNPGLRKHAIACLNIIAESCGYTSAGELVISNVDYIVNAVGLKLNFGDVSPQAPQVLLMAMRLCGPSLLPYLDDLVASIFGALERYHGYPKLVELLFAVLKGMVEEGVKTPPLAITATEEQGVEEKRQEAMSKMLEMFEQIKKLATEARKQEEDIEGLPKGSFPREPWQSLESKEKDEEAGSQDGEPSNEVAEAQDPPPPAPRIFDILLKISELTQHYLTSSSASLRVSLLSLLNTTIPALAKHENSFLPLINTLWPVLLPRLEDPEAYIVANALDTVTLMCTHAGNFMRSRIESAWKLIKTIYQRTLKRASDHPKGKSKAPRLIDLSSIVATGPGIANDSDIVRTRPEIYIDAPSRMIWDALVRLLCAITQHVYIQEKRFDDILDMLDPVLSRPDVKRALDCRNADAVWLRLYKKSKKAAEARGDEFELPVELGGPVKAMAGAPPEWGFVKL